MIFTDEQISRLPGSKVKLRCGAEVTCRDPDGESTKHWVSFLCRADSAHAAETVIFACRYEDGDYDTDIAEVLEWDDHPIPKATPPKVTQIATARNGDDPAFAVSVTALCDDGSIWTVDVYSGDGGHLKNYGWAKLPPIPHQTTTGD